MATIKFNITSTSLTASKTFTATDQDMADLIKWAGVAYAARIDEMFNPDHNPGFVPTSAQIANALVTATMDAWTQAEHKFSIDEAIKAATPPPPMEWS